MKIKKISNESNRKSKEKLSTIQEAMKKERQKKKENYSPQKNHRTSQEKLKRELKTKAEINNMEKRGIFKAKKEIRFSKKSSKTKKLFTSFKYKNRRET